MKVRIKEILDGIFSMYIDYQNVSESRVTAWSGWYSNFRTTADPLDLALLLSVLEQRIFKFIRRPFLEHCHFLKQIVTKPFISLACETESHTRVFWQKILRVIYAAAIGQQIRTFWTILQYQIDINSDGIGRFVIDEKFLQRDSGNFSTSCN